MIRARSMAMSCSTGLTGLSASSQMTPGIAIRKTATSAISTGRKTLSTSLLKLRALSSPCSSPPPTPPDPCSRLENIGTKAAENAPSANRRRNTLGMMKAWNQASVTAFAPSTRLKIISRAMPATRLTIVSPPIVPTFLRRLTAGASYLARVRTQLRLGQQAQHRCRLRLRPAGPAYAAHRGR